MTITLFSSGGKGPEESPVEEIAARLKLEQQFRSGANWFYWLAGLSVINSVIALGGGDTSFPVGLAVTQIMDALAVAEPPKEGVTPASVKAVVFFFDLLMGGVVLLFGRWAHRRKQWAFILGMSLYALDGVIFLLIGYYLGFAFHCWAFFGLFLGLRACKELVVLEAIQPGMARPL